MGRVWYSVIIIISTVLFIPITKGVFYHFIDKQKTWTEAKEYCEYYNGTLASGDIDDYKNHVPSGASAFIGTIQIKAWMWMFGCYDQSADGNLDTIRQGPGIKQTSRLSFSACVIECYRYTYIAVEERGTNSYSCYCLNNTDRLREQTSRLCPLCIQISKSCGTNGRLALYRPEYREAVTSSTPSQANVCGSIVIKDTGYSFNGRDCSEQLGVIFQSSPQGATYTLQEGMLTWYQAIEPKPAQSLLLRKDLRSEKLLPQTVNIRPTEVWIWMFQEIVKTSNIELIERINPYTCGRLTKSQIDFINCNGIYGSFICQTNNPNAIPKNDIGSNLVLIIACSVVGVLILAVIGIVIVCCLMKNRKNSQDNNAQTKPPEDNFAEDNKFISDLKSDNSVKAQSRGIDNDDGTYDLLCKQGGKRDETSPMEDLYDHAPAPAGENDYHVFNTKNDKSSTGDTYDHISNTKILETRAQHGSNYDHVEIASDINLQNDPECPTEEGHYYCADESQKSEN